MATSETSSVSETVGENTAATGVSAIKEEDNASTRPSSPDPSCPICLDNVTDAAYTDMCCHRFCFHCLVSWSRVKPECPLCKQRFSLIIHNVRSMGDYDELPVTWTEPPNPALDANFFISVAFQRPRFRYRTTGGWSWRFHDVLAGPSSHANANANTSTSPAIPNSTLPNPISSVSSNTLIVPTPTTATAPFFPPESSNAFMGNTVAMEWRRRRQVSASEFRNNIYRHNQWVCPAQPRNGEPYRVRESSPIFYRSNPAQANRLLPWLHRELLVLLDVWYDCEEVCLRILQAITNIPIRSPRFQAMMWPYLNERTAHFIHEFYHFAISPYDMLAYDLRAEYVRRSTDSEPQLSDDNSDSSDIEVIETPEARPELIEISDDEDVVRVDPGETDSDASVEIIATIPPPALRPPEIIDLVEDSGASDVERTSTLNGSRACQSASDTVTPADDHKLGPFSPSVADKRERVGERLRNKYQPCYKDESSSSEEEVPRRRQVRKRKRKSEPSKKRKKVVESYSSSDSNSDQEVQERLQPSNLKSSNISSNRKPHSPIKKFKPPSSSDEKSSESKSSSSSSTTESSVRSRCSERRKKSALPSTSHKDKARFIDVSKDNNFKAKSDFTTDYLSVNSLSPSLSSHTYSPIPFNEKNENRPSNNESTDANNDMGLLDFKWSTPLYSGSDDDTSVNLSAVCSSASRSSSPKPRLKSIVKKIEPNIEAGCSNWPLHNLRQRKVTRYVYAPYFSTSDSDS